MCGTHTLFLYIYPSIYIQLRRFIIETLPRNLFRKVSHMVHVKKLSNGITIVLENMDYLRSVSLGVWVRVGSANETKENNGIAHVIEHMLFKGTKNRSAKKLADDCAMLGGNLNAYTSKECTSFYMTTLDYHINNAVELLSDMLCNSLISEEDLEKEKGVIIEEIDMYDDSPDDLVHELLQKEVWKHHPLGYIISGTKQNVESFKRADIIDFMNQYYVADNMVISIAGHFDEDGVMDNLEKYFGQIKNSGKESDFTSPKFHQTFVTRTKDIEQIHMNLAFDAVSSRSEEKYIMSIVNSIFGGSDSSVLFQKVREELGLAYSVFSYASPYNKAGLFQIDVTLNPVNASKVFKTIISIMEEFRRDGIREEELNQAKEQMNTEFIIGNESSRNRMNGNAKALLYHERLESISEIMEQVNKITVEQANAFIRKYFTTNCFSMCLIGNLDKTSKERIESIWKKHNTMQ